MPSPVGLPPGGQVWRVDGAHVYVVYFAPGTNVPLIYHVNRVEDLQGLYGPENKVTFDREVSSAELGRLGAVKAGVLGDIRNTTANPFDGMVERFDREAAVRPALRDPSVRAAMAEAVIEGRAFTETDLQLTDWYRRSTDEQRAWEQLAASNPREAQQQMESGRIRVRDALAKGGYQNAPASLVDYYTQKWVTGEIDEVQLQDAIRRETDPYAPGASPFAGRELPAGSQVVKRGSEFYVRTSTGDYRMTGPGQVARYGQGAVEVGDVHQVGEADDVLTVADATGLGGEEQVRQLVAEWLGPYYAKGYTDEWTARWAGQIRNGGPGQADILIEQLRNAKNALLPGTDPGSSYETLASPWRGVYARFAGAMPDESADVTFQTLLRNNDAAVNEQLLRTTGRQRGWAPVVEEITGAMQKAFGGQVLSGAR